MDWCMVLLLAGCGPKTGAQSAAARCENPTSVPQRGPEQRPSGYEACGDGVVHRLEAVACDPAGQTEGTCTAALPEAGGCSTDTECSDGTLCLQAPLDEVGCSCRAPCASDADCGDGEVCYCDGAESTCIVAECRTDADCDDGEQCRLQEDIDACGTVRRALFCTSRVDTCRHHGDCTEDCHQCKFNGDQQAWACVTTNACLPCG